MDYANIKYNFIIGHGRGGTTLLLYLLNAHPNIYGLPEFKNILISKDASNISHFQKITLQYLSRLEKRSFLSQLPESLKTNKADTNLLYSTFNSQLSLRERYIRIALSINKVFDPSNRDKSYITHIIHKVPYYTFFVEELIQIFPESKFIINIRDPRAQNYSHIKRHSTEKVFLGKSHPEGRTSLWNFYAKETIELLQKYPERCYLFQYEKFVENPEKIMKEILQFLDVPYNEKIWDYHLYVKEFLSKAQPYLSENKIKKYIPLSKPVSTEYKEDWKKMNPKDIEIIEYISKPYMQKFGYTPIHQNPKISIFSKIKITFYQLWYWMVIKSSIAKYIHKIYQQYFF